MILEYRLLLTITLTATLVHTTHAAEKLSIPQIQGKSLNSEYVRRTVQTEGIITFSSGGSFYMYDPIGDGDDATSDAILVKRKKHGFKVGDRVKVEGQVEERSPFGTVNNHPITAISKAVVEKLSDGETIAPVLIGSDGLLPPTETVYPAFESENPKKSGMAFYESLESAYLRLQKPIVVGPTNKFGEFYVVVENGKYATGMNSLGGITLTPGDQNPEIIQIQLTKKMLENANNHVGVGDRFEFLEGIMSYNRGAYELSLIKVGSLSRAETNQKPIEVSDSDPNTVTIASYNVENLDPKLEELARATEPDDDIESGKFAGIAEHIVKLIRAPDIVALQEVQDNDGAEYSSTTSSDLTLKTLIEAIKVIGGPSYEFAVIDPEDDSAGGQPGGNIRVAYLFNPDRVSLEPGSLITIDVPEFEQTRLPLFATFVFKNNKIQIVNAHLSSKGGSDPVYGTIQPPRDRSLHQRTAQARAIREKLRTFIVSKDSSIIALGDFNSYWFESPMLLLSGGIPVSRNLTTDKPPLERISYVFQGNSQSLDHVVVALGPDQTAKLHTFHVNSKLPERERISDHDPKLVVLSFE